MKWGNLGEEKGSIQASFQVGGRNTDAVIEDVLYVKNLRHSLLSVAKLDKKGFTVIFGNQRMLIRKLFLRIYKTAGNPLRGRIVTMQNFTMVANGGSRVSEHSLHHSGDSSEIIIIYPSSVNIPPKCTKPRLAKVRFCQFVKTFLLKFSKKLIIFNEIAKF